MKNFISVELKHIKRGKRKDSLLCPVALAIREQVSSVWHLQASYKFLDVNYARYHTPRSVLRFMRKFDAAKPVKPFNFILKES